MKNVKVETVVNIPEWAEYFHRSGDAPNEARAYATVPLVYRCVRLISDSLSSVPLRCYRGTGDNRTEVDWPWAELDPAGWTYKTTAALLISGAAYSVRLGNGLRRGMGLQWVNPSSIVPSARGVDEYGRPVIRFTQSNATGGQVSSWGMDQMLYIREYNPADDVLPGPSAARVALTDAGLIRYLTRFASYYFEKGAMPLTILSVDRNTSDVEVKRVEGLFKQLASGISKAWSVIALRGGKDSAPFTLTPPLRDLVISELHEQARRAVAAAFGIPQTMLEDAANYATASEHTMQFWQTCVRPRGRMITAALNEQIGKSMGLTFEYAFDELDIFQEDEAQRASSLVQLTNAGLSLLDAMDILGYDMDADMRARLEADQAEKKRAAEEMAKVREQTPPAVQREAQPDTPQDEQKADLERWQRKAIKALEKSGTADVHFESEYIPAEQAEAIHARLAVCKTAAEVRAAFDVRPRDPLLVLADEIRAARLAIEADHDPA